MKQGYFLLLAGLLLYLFSCKSHNESSKQESFSADTSKKKLAELNLQIKEHPGDADLYNKRATYYMHENQFALALQDLNKATTLSPTNPAYYLTLSDVYLLMGNTTNCGNVLNKALALDPNNNQAFLRMAKLNLIIKEYKTSMEYLGKALQADAVNPEAYFLKALVLLESSDTIKAVDNLKKAVDQKQNYYEALMELGELYAMKKDKITANYFLNALKVRPRSREAYYNLGMFYQETGQYENAITTYTTLSKLDSTYRNAPYNIGYIYLVYLKEFGKATGYFSEAIHRDPVYFEAYYNRGYSFELQGKYDDAAKDYQKTLAIKTNYQKAIDGLNRIDQVKMKH